MNGIFDDPAALYWPRLFPDTWHLYVRLTNACQKSKRTKSFTSAVIDRLPCERAALHISVLFANVLLLPQAIKIRPVYLHQMLPPTVNMKTAYANGTDTEQNFIQNLSLFLCTYLKEHGALVEKDNLRTLLLEVRVCGAYMHPR